MTHVAGAARVITIGALVVAAGGCGNGGPAHAPSSGQAAASAGVARTSPLSVTPGELLDGPVLFTRQDIGSPHYLPLTSLYSIAPSGGRLKQLTHQPGGIDAAVASPDGRRIAFTEQTYGRKPRERYVNGEYVHVVNADGSHDRTVYRCVSSACGELSWSPDSTRLLITDNRTHILEPDGQVQLLCLGGCPGDSPDEASWSPDGRQLAFQYWVNVPLQNGQQGPGGTSTVDAIGVVGADGSNPHPITDLECGPSNHAGCTDDTGPVWSPDGSTIAFVRTMPPYLLPNNSRQGLPIDGSTEQLAAIRPDGSTRPTLWGCRHCGIESTAWSPTGQQLAFVSDDYQDGGRHEVVTINVIDSRTGERASEQLHVLTRAQGGPAPDVVWAPTGRNLALGAGALGVPPGVSLVSVEPDKLGKPRRLIRNGAAPITWLPRRP